MTPELGYASTSLYRGSDERTASSAGSSLTLLKALAGNKETWVTEFQGGPFRQDYLWRGIQLEAEINQVFSHGIQALYIYRWDPLMAGAEPWINGMIDVGNYDTEKRLRTKEVIAGLRADQHIVATGHNVKARIGIHLTRASLWDASLKSIPLNEITTGLYALFLDLGFEVTFLTEPVNSEPDVALVCVPYIQGLTSTEWQVLQDYIQSGGLVVAELPMNSLADCQDAGRRLQLDCREWIRPIYFIAGWSVNNAQQEFGGFAFHDRVLLNSFVGETIAAYRDNDEPALIAAGPEGRLLIPTFALGHSYVSSFHYGLRRLLRTWLPSALQPDIVVQGVPDEYRSLLEARIVESDEGTLLFVINRSGYDWEVTVTPRGYRTATVQLPTHGAVRTRIHRRT